MDSLRARKKKKLALGMQSSRSKKGKAKPLLDLDNYLGDTEDDGEDANNLMANEQKQLQLLDKTLAGCVRCGSEKYCKIDKVGNHVHLTFNQRRGWANALVRLSYENCSLWSLKVVVGSRNTWRYPQVATQRSPICCLFSVSSQDCH